MQSLPSWGPASGAPKQIKGPEARVSGGAREAREDWATGSESPCQQSLNARPKGDPTLQAFQVSYLLETRFGFDLVSSQQI